MGCDIHMFVEVKVRGTWQLYSCPRIQRNYDLFYFLAGVRGPRHDQNIPMGEAKGLPEDLSELVKIEYNYDQGDAHSESWLNREEIEQMCQFADKFVCKWPGQFEHEQLGYANGNPFSSIGDGDEEDDAGHPSLYQDCRIVFWFDN
jgi:hypothetical protein